MQISDVHIHTRVIRKNLSGCKPMIGEIVSDEIKRNNSGGQFQVLVQYERESRPRWVGGGTLVKVDW